MNLIETDEKRKSNWNSTATNWHTIDKYPATTTHNRPCAIDLITCFNRKGWWKSKNIQVVGSCVPQPQPQLQQVS